MVNGNRASRRAYQKTIQKNSGPQAVNRGKGGSAERVKQS
eukprot:COSAG02_NODE_51790_length_312_cov_0.464789_1_plen_39_part_10